MHGSYSIIYDVDKQCGMEEFAAKHIIGYKQESGFGYYEFTKEEYLKPHKRVIIVDKVQ